ncbi:hypothetical protein PV10_05007 [Exophiala mesophila]|uniref:Proline dehydrogenase n=1 Tax=Exophiala mesophila TaxID=212818 RepID=A0A0D1XZX4_EXOME|nr:uncharacterized protein PV10_05007 [Exophiala mesophila]KIV93821.1 hypothetical protein PV10_05007 [Exophiala mesophila]
MGAMNIIIQSKSPLLNPDRNPIVRGVIRALVYDHFCAGATVSEVKKTITEIKAAGYAGVILGYGREIVVDARDASSAQSKGPIESDSPTQQDEHIAQWFEGNRATLAMIGANDYMNIKFTGAGPNVSKCLASGAEPPEQLRQAMDALCTQAASQKSQIWIDAEQQIFQPTIDTWTLNLMRKYNRNHQALVWTTIQTYLKSSRQTVGRFLQYASEEGWTLGIKQVRGAYIASEMRDRIWDTKEQTDESYNGIARDLLRKETGQGVLFPGFTASEFPDLRLFLAGHNKDSVRMATSLVTELVQAGRQVPPIQYGQLQGMADDISCDLVQQYEDISRDASEHKGEESYELKLRTAPLAYKCLCWGSVTEVLNFLMRRAVENASAAERLKDGMVELRKELKRRMLFKTT